MAVTSDAARLPRAIHVPRPGRGARRFSLGFLLGIVLVLGAVVVAGSTLAGRILPGVSIGGVDVGGLRPDEARAALVAAFGGLEAGETVVTSVRGTVTIEVADVGRTVDIEGMWAEAAALGRGGSRLDEVLAALRLSREPVDLPIRLSYDRTRLTALLAAFEDRTYLRPLDARVIASASGFTVVPSVPGVRVDTADVAAELDAALRSPRVPPRSMSATSAPVPPRTGDRDARRARAAAERIATDLKLVRGDASWKVKGARIRSWITFSGVGAGYEPTVDPSGVPAALKKVRKDVAKKPREAEFLRTRGGAVFGVRASSAGRALDVEATTADVLATLATRAAGLGGTAPVRVTTMKVAPEFTTDEATRKAPLVVRLGAWTTRYQVSAHNGFAANITIPARKLDGVVVRPGATFDFWRALGEVSFRTGYRLGGAIVGGHTVEGRALAGGICAASTTLFNAAARGGLEIVTRAPHWYYIPRYPLGLDATVSDAQTMRFRNDTKHPVLITASASPGVVRFEIWSVPNGRTVSWSKPRVTNVVKGYDTTRATSSLPKGQRERIEWPVDGKDVSITRTVRDADGRVVHRDTFVSHYHRMIGITLVGR